MNQRLRRDPQRVHTNCIFRRGAPIQPRFVENRDANHVTRVGAVTLSGNAMIPLLLSNRMHLPSEIAGSHITDEFRYFHTTKDYLHRQAMDYWLETILLPYVKAIRVRPQPRIIAVLILDGPRNHNTQYTGKVFQNQEICVIELPAQTIYVYQPFDLYIFGITKKEYQISGPINMGLQEKLSKKIEKILKILNSIRLIALLFYAFLAIPSTRACSTSSESSRCPPRTGNVHSRVEAPA
jgi:hypothetical protein